MSVVKADTPQWFVDATQTPYQTHRITRPDCEIEYYQWGSSDKPLLLLVHGNGGHANWWDFIAPSFMDQYCVCAIHLAGMGNSGYRDKYEFSSYAEDVIAVAQDAGYTKNITLVGHSMGGVVSMHAAENHPDKIQSLIIIDTPIVFRKSNDESESHKPPPPAHHKFKGKKYYEDFDTALSRFRLVPPQDCKNQFLVEHVGSHSIKQFEQGWSWKFDDGIYFNFIKPDKPPFTIAKLQCKMAYLYADDSALVPQSVAPDIRELLKDKGPVFEISNAHHHVLLDEPLQLIARMHEILELFSQQSQTS